MEKIYAEIRPVLVECPICGSVEFAIEQETEAYTLWVICRNCNHTMGEVT